MADGDVVPPDHAVRNLLADLMADEPYWMTHGSSGPCTSSGALRWTPLRSHGGLVTHIHELVGVKPAIMTLDLNLTAEQVQLVETFASVYEKQAAPEHIHAAKPIGFDPSLWRSVFEIGVISMAVGEEHGGWGASPLDLALIAGSSRAGSWRRCRSSRPRLPPVCWLGSTSTTGGRTRRGLPRRPPRNRSTPCPHVGRQVGLVPAAAVADEALVLAGERLMLVPLDHGRGSVENLGSMPVADVTITDE